MSSVTVISGVYISSVDEGDSAEGIMQEEVLAKERRQKGYFTSARYCVSQEEGEIILCFLNTIQRLRLWWRYWLYRLAWALIILLDLRYSLYHVMIYPPDVRNISWRIERQAVYHGLPDTWAESHRWPHYNQCADISYMLECQKGMNGLPIQKQTAHRPKSQLRVNLQWHFPDWMKEW